MLVAKKGGYVTGLNNITDRNDIVVESGADGVTNPFRASVGSHFADAGSLSRILPRFITVQFPSLAKDVHQGNCMSIVS